MENLNKMVGFEAVDNFTLNKSLELVSACGIKSTITDIPVLVSCGAKFSEVFSNRDINNKHFYFNPYGIVSPGEKIVISEEELRYLIERKMINILFP
jgi:hypothetical protein